MPAGLADVWDMSSHIDRELASISQLPHVAFAEVVADSGRWQHGTRPTGGNRMSVFALIHPGRRLGGVLFVKDLFVQETARGKGVGEALLRFLAAHARARGIRRLDLTTEPQN